MKGTELKQTSEGQIGVLGVLWDPVRDEISYKAVLNFSNKKHGQRTLSNLTKEEVPKCLPETLTKRLVLQQVMGIYDPLGFIAPFTLLARVLLRETWQLGLDWDDPLPPSSHKQWTKYFKDMFLIENLAFPRCLRPAHCFSNPWLLLLSDGSSLAYGCAAYLRWQLPDNSVKVSLIMSKCPPQVLT